MVRAFTKTFSQMPPWHIRDHLSGLSSLIAISTGASPAFGLSHTCTFTSRCAATRLK
jgi:hypothetical protein